MEWWEEEAANNNDEVRARHQDNRIAWNEGARGYAAANDERVAALKAGKSNLHPVERENLARFGPLQNWCKRAIHLQCASGYDTLSLLLEGADEVVGVDISDVHIDNARWTSTQLNLPAQWVCCDVLDVPVELNNTADLVYTGRGAINWLHDIDAWACVVARLLRPNGVLSLLEDHPASWLFDPNASSIRALGVSYFGHAEASQSWPTQYLGDLGKPNEQHAVKHERCWPIAEVFQALVKAGLVVEHLGEHAREYWSAFPNLSAEEKAKLPLTYSLLARKPQALDNPAKI